jgi:hypothetical protein
MDQQCKNSEDHPDHNNNGEDTDTPYFKPFNTFNILNIIDPPPLLADNILRKWLSM